MAYLRSVRGAMLGLALGSIWRKKGHNNVASSAVSMAVDVSGLVGIFCGLQCALEDSGAAKQRGDMSGMSLELLRAATAGALGGAWFGARTTHDARAIAGCAVGVAGCAVGVAALSAATQPGSWAKPPPAPASHVVSGRNV